MRATGGRSPQEPSPNFTYLGPIVQTKKMDPRDLLFNQGYWKKKSQSTEPPRVSRVTPSADLDRINRVKTVYLPPSAIYNTLYAPQRENGAIYNPPMCTYQGVFHQPGQSTQSTMYHGPAHGSHVIPYSPTTQDVGMLNPPIDPTLVALSQSVPPTADPSKYTYQGSFNTPGPLKVYQQPAPKPYITPCSSRAVGARLNPPIDPAPVNLDVLAPSTTNRPLSVNYNTPYTARKEDIAMFDPPMYTDEGNFIAPTSSTMSHGHSAYGSNICTPQKDNGQSAFNSQTYTYGSHIPGPSTMYSPPAPGPYIHPPTGHPIRDYYNTFCRARTDNDPASDPHMFTHQGGINKPTYATICRLPPVLDDNPHDPRKEDSEGALISLKCADASDVNPPAPPSMYPSPPAPYNNPYNPQTSNDEPIIDLPNDPEHTSPNTKREPSPIKSPVMRTKRKYVRRKLYERPSDPKPNIETEPFSPAPNPTVIRPKRKYLRRKAKVQCEMKLKAIKEESLSPLLKEESLSPPLKEENTSLTGVHMEKKKCVYPGPYSCFLECGKAKGNGAGGCEEHGIGEELSVYGNWLRDTVRGEEDVEKLKVGGLNGAVKLEGDDGEDHCADNEFRLEDWLDLEAVERDGTFAL